MFIFKEILNSDEEYISAQNIVIRSRMRRNGKIFGECHSSESLKSIIKHDNTLHFGFSTLDASQRLSLREIVFYYRTRELVYSEGITIVVDKHELQLIFFIHQHPKVIEKARMEGYYATRLMLMSKDRSSINDIIDQKGYVLGKGDLYSVLAKEKNAVLVVEGDPVCLGEQ